MFFFDRIKEAFERVAKDEARKLSTVQEIMIRRKDHLRHAVHQGLCGILIISLKLLANQQEFGDGLMQNIVTNLCEQEGSQRVVEKLHTS